MYKVKLETIAPTNSRTAFFSLPLPPFHAAIEVEGAIATQVVPLGAWPARTLRNPRQTWPWLEEIAGESCHNPPRRALVTAHFETDAPDELSLNIRRAEEEKNTLPKVETEHRKMKLAIVPGEEKYHHRDETLYHYLRREDSLLVEAAGRKFELRAAMKVDGELRYWQWCEIVPVWSGALSCAWVAGGHIYAGPDDRPITISELPHLQTLPVYPETTVSAKCFIVVHSTGLVELTAHYTNVQGYGLGCLTPGLPVIEWRSNDGRQLSRQLEVDEGTLTESADGSCLWQPLDSTSIFIGHRQPNPLAVGIEQTLSDQWVEDSEKGFVPGVARSFTGRFIPDNTMSVPRRYLANPAWYLLCGEFGVALPGLSAEGAGKLQSLADDAARVYLRNCHPEGMSRGGVYRYLDEHPHGRYEFSMDGNEVLSLYRAAYMKGSAELYASATEAARYIADIAIDHQSFDLHYHGDTPDWKLFSLIYMRFGGLVPAYLESGDPWYLENAEAVANRWIALNRINQPRKNLGRDPEPVEGILTLYDATGKDHYFQEAEKIAGDTIRSLFADSSWRSGFGVGPYWGINALPGTPWNGSHLLAGLAELLIRSNPDTCDDYAEFEAGACRLIDRLMADIVSQTPDGIWRSAGGFMFRRYFLPLYFNGNTDLLARLDELVENMRLSHDLKGEDFYKNGHHCSGYLDGPFVYATLQNRKLPREENKSQK